MKIKLIFESEIDGEDRRFGYIIDKERMNYKTVQFDKRYDSFEVSEDKQITDTSSFGKSIWRMIKYALDEERDG